MIDANTEIAAVDDALPHPGSYPANIVCGYVGGHTYHIWTDAEIAEVANEKKLFWAIWTALNATGTLTGAMGTNDALGMVSRLQSIKYNKLFPVFYDVEPAIFDRDPNGANAAITNWKSTMHLNGYTQPYSYTVARQGGDWIADPTGVKPVTIPAGKVGVQYGGNNSFDFDVFSEALLMSANGPENWDAADFKKLFDELAAYVFLNPDITNADGTVNTSQTSFGAAFGRLRDRVFALYFNTDVLPSQPNALKKAIEAKPTGTFTISGSGSIQ